MNIEYENRPEIQVANIENRTDHELIELLSRQLGMVCEGICAIAHSSRERAYRVLDLVPIEILLGRAKRVGIQFTRAQETVTI